MKGDSEKRRAYMKAFRAAYREQTHAYNVAYRAANRGKARAYSAAYRAAHPGLGRAYSAAHPEQQRAWREAHPEQLREYNHRYRARLRGQYVAVVDIGAIYERDQGRCHICGKAVARAAASMDHLVPISKGGAHASFNVRLAHRRCNSQRHNNGPAQLLLMEA